jgi:hypothetical protein
VFLNNINYIIKDISYINLNLLIFFKKKEILFINLIIYNLISLLLNKYFIKKQFKLSLIILKINKIIFRP